MAFDDEIANETWVAYWIAFGPHGPRALPPPGEGWKVFKYTMIGCGISVVIFMLERTQARGAPRTMTKEYQEMTNEYLKVYMPLISTMSRLDRRTILEAITCESRLTSSQNQKTEPITGVSAEDYKGKGMVQSSPEKHPKIQ